MKNRRIVGQRELNAFSASVDAIQAAMPELQRTIANAETVRDGALQVGDVDSALSAVVMGAAGAMGRYQELMRAFQISVENLIGEKPAVGESPEDFFDRIAPIFDQNYMLKTMRKNNIIFMS